MANYGVAYKEVREMQTVLLNAIRSAKTEPRDLASCARAYDVLEDRKREIRQKPKLATVKVPQQRQRPYKLPTVTVDVA